MNPADSPDPTIDPSDRFVTDLLLADRPVPTTGFRGALGRYLADDDPGWGPRPEHLLTQACALITAGGLLLVLGALIGTGAI